MTQDHQHGPAGGRRGGLRSLAVTLPKVTRKALGKRGLAEGALVAEWPEIVGTVLASHCIPAKLSFHDPKRRAEGTLTLQVESGWTLELQHLSPQIIERINQSFGYQAISRLAFRQGPLPSNSAREAPKTPAAEQALSGESAPHLETTTTAIRDTIADDDLRGALENLARSLASGKPRFNKDS